MVSSYSLGQGYGSHDYRVYSVLHLVVHLQPVQLEMQLRADATTAHLKPQTGVVDAAQSTLVGLHHVERFEVCLRGERN